MTGLPEPPDPAAGRLGLIDPRRQALAGLLRICEPPVATLAQLIDEIGVIPTWSAVRFRNEAVLGPELFRITEPRVAGRSPDQMADAATRDLELAASVGARLVGPWDQEWPAEAIEGLALIKSHPAAALGAPIGLYVRGRKLPDTSRAVAIVGSRAATPYGLRIAAELGGDLAAAGMAVVSGAAFGIDAAAHRGALRVGTSEPEGPVTIAVLACGIDRSYPVAHATLLDSIAASGAVVSEYPPGTTPARYRFLVRNRLIAALTAGTVVVEAGARSGSLNTATSCELLSRVTMAVPGPVTSAVSVGCHTLIRARNAQLVTCARDVLELVGPLRPAPPEKRGVERPTDRLDAVSARVYDSLPARGPTTVAELSVDAALPSPTVLGALALLEIEGLVDRADGGWRRSRG
jgi:DNA processing protein